MNIAGLKDKHSDEWLILRHMTTKVEVVEVVAHVEVSQTYYNDQDVPVETEYTLPLDDDAAVCSFVAKIGDRTIVGQVQEQDEAQETYDDAIASGQGAYLGSVTDGAFTLSCGHIPPDTEVVLTVGYITQLKTRDGHPTFHMPTMFTPFQAGPQKTPNKRRRPQRFEFDLEATVYSSIGIKNIKTSNHKVKETDLLEDHKRGSIRLAGVVDSDVWFTLELGDPHVPHGLIQPPQRGDDGKEECAAMISFFPDLTHSFNEVTMPTGNGQGGIEIVFLIDQSGSMTGARIEEAKRTLTKAVQKLPDTVRFDIISFGSTYKALFEQRVFANSKNKATAYRYINNIEANLGGTELIEPLRHVYQLDPEEGWVRNILLLTDGAIYDMVQVFDLIRMNSHTTRLFTFGIGDGVNETLVKGAARAGRGTWQFIEDSTTSALESAVIAQLDRALQPALTRVKVEFFRRTQDGVEPLEVRVVPHILPPIFNLYQYVLFAWITVPEAGLQPEHVIAVLRAQTPNGSELEQTIFFQGFGELGQLVPWQPDTPRGTKRLSQGGDSTPRGERKTLSKVLATLVARELVRELEEVGEHGGQQLIKDEEERRAEIRRLGKRYNLATSQTSFVAVEHRNAPVSQGLEVVQEGAAASSSAAATASEFDPATALAAAAADAAVASGVASDAPAAASSSGVAAVATGTAAGAGAAAAAAPATSSATTTTGASAGTAAAVAAAAAATAAGSSAGSGSSSQPTVAGGEPPARPPLPQQTSMSQILRQTSSRLLSNLAATLSQASGRNDKQAASSSSTSAAAVAGAGAGVGGSADEAAAQQAAAASAASSSASKEKKDGEGADDLQKGRRSPRSPSRSDASASGSEDNDDHDGGAAGARKRRKGAAGAASPVRTEKDGAADATKSPKQTKKNSNKRGAVQADSDHDSDAEASQATAKVAADKAAAAAAQQAETEAAAAQSSKSRKRTAAAAAVGSDEEEDGAEAAAAAAPAAKKGGKAEKGAKAEKATKAEKVEKPAKSAKNAKGAKAAAATAASEQESSTEKTAESVAASAAAAAVTATTKSSKAAKGSNTTSDTAATTASTETAKDASKQSKTQRSPRAATALGTGKQRAAAAAAAAGAAADSDSDDSEQAFSRMLNQLEEATEATASSKSPRKRTLAREGGGGGGGAGAGAGEAAASSRARRGAASASEAQQLDAPAKEGPAKKAPRTATSTPSKTSSATTDDASTKAASAKQRAGAKTSRKVLSETRSTPSRSPAPQKASSEQQRSPQPVKAATQESSTSVTSVVRMKYPRGTTGVKTSASYGGAAPKVSRRARGCFEDPLKHPQSALSPFGLNALRLDEDCGNLLYGLFGPTSNLSLKTCWLTSALTLIMTIEPARQALADCPWHLLDCSVHASAEYKNLLMALQQFVRRWLRCAEHLERSSVRLSEALAHVHRMFVHHGFALGQNHAPVDAVATILRAISRATSELGNVPHVHVPVIALGQAEFTTPPSRPDWLVIINRPLCPMPPAAQATTRDETLPEDADYMVRSYMSQESAVIFDDEKDEDDPTNVKEPCMHFKTYAVQRGELPGLWEYDDVLELEPYSVQGGFIPCNSKDFNRFSAGSMDWVPLFVCSSVPVPEL